MEITEKIAKELAKQTVIITTTWYNPNSKVDVVRSKLALITLKTAMELGYTVIVVDSGSSDEFLQEMEQYGVTIIKEPHQTMGHGRRVALREALKTDKKVIAWTEPEKVSYLPELAKTVLPIIENSADLVIPERESLNSYPILQQHAEMVGNLFWKELTSTDLDMWFGPRTWHRDLSHYFLDYNGEYGDKWEFISMPVIDALVDKKRVVGVKVNYVNPAEQTSVEKERLSYFQKRLEQLENITKAMAAYWEKRSSIKIVPWDKH